MNAPRIFSPGHWVAAVAALIVTTACPSGPTPFLDDHLLVETRVVDEAGALVAPYGGEGVLAASQRAIALTTPLGAVLGEGEFDVERITIAIPPSESDFMIDLRNDDGDTLARVFVEGVIREEGDFFAAPISTESSLEAVVFAALLRPDALGASMPLLTIQSRIPASVARAVADAKLSAGEDRIEVAALANALHGAVVVEREVVAELGPPWDPIALAEEERIEFGAISRMFYEADDADSAAVARESFRVWSENYRELNGLNAAGRLEAAQAESYFVRARSMTAIEEQGGETSVSFAIAQAQLLREARASLSALTDALANHSEFDALNSDATFRVTTLIESVNEATDEEALLRAVIAFRIAIAGAGTESLFNRALNVTDVNRDAANSARDQARVESQTLTSRLSEFDPDLRAAPTSPMLNIAQNVAQEFVAMRVRLSQNAVGLGVFGPRGTTGLALLLIAERIGVGLE